MKIIATGLAALGVLASHASAEAPKYANLSAGQAAQQMAGLLKPQAVGVRTQTWRTAVHAVPFGSLCQATEVRFALDGDGRVADISAAPIFHALETPKTPVPRDQPAADAATDSACAGQQTAPTFFRADSAHDAAKGVYILGRIPIVLPVIPVDCREIDGDCKAGIRAFTADGLTAISDCGRNEIDNRCWLFRYPGATVEVYVNADYVPFKVIATRTLIAFDPIHDHK
jgi:hypothetical protein